MSPSVTWCHFVLHHVIWSMWHGRNGYVMLCVNGRFHFLLKWLLSNFIETLRRFLKTQCVGGMSEFGIGVIFSVSDFLFQKIGNDSAWFWKLWILGKVCLGVPTQTPTQKLKSGFLRFSSQKIHTGLIWLEMIFEAVQSEPNRFNFLHWVAARDWIRR